MSSGESALAREYRRLLRWYPKAWRSANEDAMLGTLLDQAEHEGRAHPTSSERFAIVRGGIAAWVRAEPPARRMRLFSLGAAALFAVVYAWLIVGPVRGWPGAIGPFANPSIVCCALLVAAFVCALFAPGRIANVLALAAAGAETVIGIAAQFHPPFSASPWQGPSSYTATLLVGFGLLGGLALSRVWMLAVGALLVASAVAAGLVVEFVTAELGYFSVVSTGIVIGIGVALVACVIIAVLGRHSDARRRPAIQPE